MAVFRRRIRDKLNRAMANRSGDGMIAAENRVNRAKNELMEIIDKDPISERVLNSEFTRGYLGVTPGGSEVQNLKNYIFESTRVTSQKNVQFKGERGISISYNIKYPQKNEIYSQESLSLPWTSKTWVQAMELGIGNISRFLFIQGKGRSSFGIQRPKSFSGRSEITDPNYLTRIRQEFSNALSNAGLRRKR